MDSVYEVLTFHEAVKVLKICDVTFTSLKTFNGKIEQFHILMKNWKNELSSSKPRNLIRFSIVPFIPLGVPLLSMYPAILAVNATALQQQTRGIQFKRVEEIDKHKLKEHLDMDSHAEDDIVIAINMMKNLLSPSIKNQLETHLIPVPVGVGRILSMIEFLRTNYSPSLEIDLSRADARMNTVHDEFGVHLMIKVIDNERSIRINIPNAPQYDDDDLKILLKLGIRRNGLKGRLSIWCLSQPNQPAGGLWATWTYEIACMKILEAVKESPELEVDVVPMKNGAKDIHVNFAGVKKPLSKTPFDGECFKCGRKGHRANDCRVKMTSKAVQSADPKGRKPCSWCHKMHLGECTIKKSDLARNSNAKPRPFVNSNSSPVEETKYTANKIRTTNEDMVELDELRAFKKSKTDEDQHAALRAQLMEDVRREFSINK